MVLCSAFPPRLIRGRFVSGRSLLPDVLVPRPAPCADAGAFYNFHPAFHHSDRTLERRYHAALGYLVSAIGLVGIGVFANSPALAFTALVIAATAPLSGHQAFWQMPTMLLAGTAAATGIALINSIGNLSGWLGPSVVGWLEDLTGKTSTGLYVLAGLEVLAAVLILFFMPHRIVSTGEIPPKCET